MELALAMAEGNSSINSVLVDNGFCYICKESLVNTDKAVTSCRHVLHKSCLTIWSRDKNSCPVCDHTIGNSILDASLYEEPHMSIEEQGVGLVVPNSISGPNTRSKSTAPLSSKRRRTNSVMNNTKRPKQDCTNRSELNVLQIQQMIDSSMRTSQREIINALKQEMGNMIDQRIDKTSLNSAAPASVPYYTNNSVPLPSNIPRSSGNQNAYTHVPNECLSSSNSFRPTSESNTKTIINWKISFDGSMDKMPVEEFIYRINALTRTSLSGDYTALCQNAHLLFEGKAKAWFWRYHKSVPAINWIDLCESLKKSFRDIRTDFEVKEQIRARSQKAGECFEKYFDAVMCLCDCLKVPFEEYELIEVLKRNLKDELNIAMLHLNFRSIAELRAACNKHENYLESSGKGSNKVKFSYPFRKQVAEIDDPCVIVDDCNLSALNKDVSKLQTVCWNCEETGHNYMQCVKPRRVFCHGCGLIGFFLHNCPKCSVQGNRQRDITNNTRRYPDPPVN